MHLPAFNMQLIRYIFKRGPIFETKVLAQVGAERLEGHTEYCHNEIIMCLIVRHFLLHLQSFFSIQPI